MPALPLKILITTGDKDGIGLEVAEKALAELGPQSKVHFLIWRHRQSFPKSLKRLQSLFTTTSFTDEAQAFEFFRSPLMKSSCLVEIVSEKSPALWVEKSARWCFDHPNIGMVTGPISKTEIRRAGLRDMGHTDILKRVSKVPQVHMGFLGTEFNVLLTTAHIPLTKVPAALTSEALNAGLTAANQLRRYLPASQQKLPIGVLGLNPHAGEDGLIGQEEKSLFGAVFKHARSRRIPVVGPLVPDAAFLKSNWAKHSVFLAMYHDQGLIPFKLVHGQDSGVHVSVGLPFVRTSVDHGTAKDIFGKNRANPASMVDAVRACVRLMKSSIKR